MNKSIAVLFCFTLAFFVVAHPQDAPKETSPTAAGVALYEKGDLEGAIKALHNAVKKSKSDSTAWHYLGLANVRLGNLDKAREALGKATELRATAIRLEFTRNEEWRDDQLTNLKQLLADHIESQSKLIESFNNPEDEEKGKLALETTRIQIGCVERRIKVINGSTVLKREDMAIEKLKILSKSEPQYPDSARTQGIAGTVYLKAILAADGTVQHLEILRSPDRRLTEASVKTARMIKFKPETFCGRPISSPTQLEYGFFTF